MEFTSINVHFFVGRGLLYSSKDVSCKIYIFTIYKLEIRSNFNLCFMPLDEKSMNIFKLLLNLQNETFK